LRGTGRAKEAEEEHRTALAICKDLVETFPAVPDYQSSLGANLNSLARLLMQREGELPQVRQLLEQAVKHQQEALRTNPRHPTYRRFLCNHYMNLARTVSP